MESRTKETARSVASSTHQDESGARGQRRKRRWPRRAGIAALLMVVVVAASTVTNLILEKRERSRITPYGERVRVTGGTMNVWRNGHAGPTIVLLGGLGTAAPAMDFAPLARELDGYDVVVVERFGYGYADMQGPPQTIENVTAELHEALSRIGVGKPYVLVGHSISGFYTLAYAHRYPDEVSAVVGIDATVPSADASSPAPTGGGIDWGRVLAVTGVVRGVYSMAPSLAVPDGDAYTADEIRRIRAMTIWNFGSPAVVDETRRIGSNATALRGVAYPDALPVLDLLAEDTVHSRGGWVKLHEDRLRNVERHEVVVLEGGHYLHWTQSRRMAAMITGFVSRK